MGDTDSRAIHSNMRKAQGVWARVSRVLGGENASPRVCGTFYRATVQAVLLYGSESWNITLTAMRMLEGFHAKAAWQMATVNRPERQLDDTWVYPATEDVLEEVGLQT
eukprot:13815834-Ditylum_brightwellii.AAC.1